MPKDNVERAIKKASEKDTADYKPVNFEGYGPHGIAVFVETATNNNQRTVASVRSYFTRNGGSLGTSGSLEFLFTHQCQFSIQKGEFDPEELELELIDFGAEEVFEDTGENGEESKIAIYGEFQNFGAIQSQLEEIGAEIISSGFERIPHDTKELNEEQQAEVEKLLSKFDEDDDIQNVYHNMG
jgi:YebC/PmpR family DNA-binding regulatory protein